MAMGSLHSLDLHPSVFISMGFYTPPYEVMGYYVLGLAVRVYGRPSVLISVSYIENRTMESFEMFKYCWE